MLNKGTVILKYWKLMDVESLALVDSLVYKKWEWNFFLKKLLEVYLCLASVRQNICSAVVLIA